LGQNYKCDFHKPFQQLLVQNNGHSLIKWAVRYKLALICSFLIKVGKGFNNINLKLPEWLS